MANVINGTSTGSGGLIQTGDDSGVLNIQTNETTAITVNASQNVGIGTTSPDALLTVNTIASFGAGAAATPSIAAKGDLNTGVFFPAADTLAASTGGTERIRMDSSGNVGVRSSGTTAPTYDYNTLGEGLFLRYWDSSGNRNADLVGIGNTPAGATMAMRFFTNTGGSPGTAVERMQINSSGNVKFVGSISVGNATPTASGAGITFPATQSASSDANTLDDYEEGTWTPGITFGGGSSGMTFSGRSGRYVKIGRMVYAGFQFDLSNKGSSTGTAALTGLPISSGSSVGAQRYSGACGYYANFTSVGMIQLLIEASGTTAFLRYATSGSSSGMSDGNFTNTVSMNGMFIYETD